MCMRGRSSDSCMKQRQQHIEVECMPNGLWSLEARAARIKSGSKTLRPQAVRLHQRRESTIVDSKRSAVSISRVQHKLLQPFRAVHTHP